MNARGAPFGWLILLLLLVVATWNPFFPAPWGPWLLPGLAALSLGIGWSTRAIPLRLGMGGLALFCLIALYAWNPTHRWSEGVGLLPVEHFPGLPGSAFSAGSWSALALAVSMWAAYALAFQLSSRQIGWLQMAALLGAVAMAFSVLAQRLEPGHSRLFEYTGIFVNENHFAVFSNMILPVVLALAARSRFRAVQEGRPSSPAGLFLLAALLIGGAVVMCRSRAGVAVMALLVVVHVGLRNRLVRQYPFTAVPISSGAKRLGGLAILVVTALAVAAFAREWNHLGDIQSEWVFRSGILKDALAAWRAHPVWGTGPGTFTEVFPYYQSELFRGRAIWHAHCEPIQFLTEFGVAGSIWVGIAAWLALSVRSRSREDSKQIPPFADLERQAFACGLVACGLHSLIDFPLRIPLIALIAAVWAGVWAGHRPLGARSAGKG